MTTYVLVPGACHGGRCFDDLADQLRSRGHRVLVITLTCIAERAHLLHAGVNLETHVAARQIFSTSGETGTRFSFAAGVGTLTGCQLHLPNPRSTAGSPPMGPVSPI